MSGFGGRNVICFLSCKLPQVLIMSHEDVYKYLDMIHKIFQTHLTTEHFYPKHIAP